MNGSVARTASRPVQDGYDVALMPLLFFRQSEHIDVCSVRLLADMIASSGAWLEPIVVERHSGIIMDGNHRLNAARLLKLKKIPCVLLDYDDPRVSVHDWNTGAAFEVGRIYETIAQGQLLAYKTTRHRFCPCVPSESIALNLLAD